MKKSLYLFEMLDELMEECKRDKGSACPNAIEISKFSEYMHTHRPEMLEQLIDASAGYAFGFCVGAGVVVSMINKYGIPRDMKEILR